MKSIYEIKRYLEEIFDIPIKVEIHPGPEPGYVIRPDIPGKHFFELSIEFRNHVRMILNFVPQSYGAPFVRSMGTKPLESKALFAEYANCLQRDGCVIDFQVNDRHVSSNSPDEWPKDEWNRVVLRVTKAPFEYKMGMDYGDLVLHYGKLLLGMILSLSDIVPLEESSFGYKEGESLTILAKKYERNRLNRELCLQSKGYHCMVCGFDFEASYGTIGERFIHVHHVVPVSQIGPDYIINPLEDLVPVCPNCHAMLHRKDPPFLPEELKKILVEQLSKKNEKI